MIEMEALRAAQDRVIAAHAEHAVAAEAAVKALECAAELAALEAELAELNAARDKAVDEWVRDEGLRNSRPRPALAPRAIEVAQRLPAVRDAIDRGAAGREAAAAGRVHAAGLQRNLAMAAAALRAGEAALVEYRARLRSAREMEAKIGGLVELLASSDDTPFKDAGRALRAELMAVRAASALAADRSAAERLLGCLGAGLNTEL
jgi:hypothetical protein